MSTETNTSSTTRCFRSVVRFNRDVYTDRFRWDGQSMWIVYPSGNVERINETPESLLRDGYVEVCDAPLNWPIVDGKPINPEGFPALYKAVKKFVDTTESSEIRQSDVEPLIEALALADKLK